MGKAIVVFAVLLAVCAASAPAATDGLAVLLEKGIYQEETAGDIEAAIETYKEVIEVERANRSYAADAQLRLAGCWLKLGDEEKARSALMALVAQFPGEDAAVATALKQLAELTALGPPVVVSTQPRAFTDDVSASLDRITVTFDQPMMDGSWSWTGGGETFPETTGAIHYDEKRMTCTMPVKLEPGKYYWIGINSPSHKNFQTSARVAARRYVILFATASADGQATAIPGDRVASSRQINAASMPAPAAKDVSEEQKRKAQILSENGWALWRERKLSQAEEVFTEAVANDPTMEAALNGLGWSRLNQGKTTLARETFLKLVEINPKHSAALNGFEICRVLRGEGFEMPIIMLTAKGEESDVVLGLNLGADDYVTKPFSIRELLARAAALLRRNSGEAPDLFCFGDFELDRRSRRLTRAGDDVDLTPKEFGVLALMCEKAGRALTRDVILSAVWGWDAFVTRRSVDRCVNTLRGKIEPDPARPSYIHTVREVGYRFDAAAL